MHVNNLEGRPSLLGPHQGCRVFSGYQALKPFVDWDFCLKIYTYQAIDYSSAKAPWTGIATGHFVEIAHAFRARAALPSRTSFSLVPFILSFLWYIVHVSTFPRSSRVCPHPHPTIPLVFSHALRPVFPTHFCQWDFTTLP